MLTLENAGALVSGGPLPKAVQEERKMIAQQATPKRPETQKVKVLRAFYHDKKLHEAGSEPTLPFVFALEMKNANKVSFVNPEPVSPVEATESVSKEPSEVQAAAEEKRARNGGSKAKAKGEGNAA